MLGGGLPLIGDVSPDCPPEYLTGIATGTRDGWLASLSNDDRQAIDALRTEAAAAYSAGSEWLRIDLAPWSALSYASRDGWPPLPGHGHNDFGGFELHYGTMPVVRDLGRRSYGPAGARDVAAAAHASLSIDGVAPYPANRPYYTDDFRLMIGGNAPARTQESDGITMESDAFRRLGGVGRWRRELRAHDDAFVIFDRLEGRGRRRIARTIPTTLPVRGSGDGLQLGAFRLTSAGVIACHEAQRWCAYGVGEPATTIVIESDVDLPWQSSIKIHAPR
jgi:hypothetical protein